MAKKLTAQQAKFVKIYLSNGRNGADAYRNAYNTSMPPLGAGIGGLERFTSAGIENNRYVF
jgi:hypothetical protein